MTHLKAGAPALRTALDQLDTAQHELMTQSAALPDQHPLAVIHRAVADAATQLEVYLDADTPVDR